ncbi:MAG: hypothetical protein M3161_02015, partial [Actinomycetota bacterium]|nr:hypothetical protein [Actinomycetota bacterium]
MKVSLRVGALVMAAASGLLMAPPAVAAAQNDARSGGDAGNTFDDATKIKPKGYYEGTLDRDGGDADDFYSFSLREGDSLSVLIDTETATTDAVTMLDPNGVVIDVGTKILGPGVTVNNAFCLTTCAAGV